jgi:hypothetical protein
MNYSVHLVQRGIPAQTHPVTGKSGKLYGQALQSPVHGGVMYQMSAKDYLDNAHDLVGNTSPGQQWVPEFMTNNPREVGQFKCDRCSKPAVAIWDRYYYCGDHAPNNAAYLDGSGFIGQPAVTAAPAASSVDTHLTPPVKERGENLTGTLQERKELPREDFRAPVIGTTHEDSPPERTAGGVFEAEQPTRTSAPATPPPPNPAPTTQVPPPAPPPAVASPAPQPAKPAVSGTAVVEAITTAVADKLTAVLPGLVEKAVDSKLQALVQAEAPKPPTKRAAAKKTTTKPEPKARPQTEFSKLQTRAKELNINSFGKNADKLKAEIAQAEAPPATAGATTAVEDEIPF